MDAITQLLSQYSGAEIFLIVLLVVAGVKFISDLYDWAHGKLKTKYDNEEEQKDKYDDIVEQIKGIDTTLTLLSTDMKEMNASFKADLTEVKNNVYSINERLLETIRSSIIDKHHKYMEKGQITDFALQSLERQYNYYKTAGGNSFIDRLMNDIRTLPIVDSDDAMKGEDNNVTGT